MKRREFLIGAAAATSLANANALGAQGNQAKLDRIAVRSANFNRVLKVGAGAPPAAERTLDLLDLAQTVADRFNVRRLELEHAHLLSTEDTYLKDLRDRVAKAKSQIVQVNVEFQASHVSANGFSARAQAIDLAKQWIDHAELLGCPRLLLNPGSLATAIRPTAIEALKIIGDYGRQHKVSVSIENLDTGAPPPAPPAPPPTPTPAAGAAGAPARGGGGGGGGRGGAAGPAAPPPTWQVVVEVIKAAGIAATPNLGNFPNDGERTAGLRALFAASSGTCHCPSDSAKYNFASAIKISRDVAYKGLYSIDTSGSSADPYAATRTALDELMKTI